MHPSGIRQEIIDRVIARRGGLHWFDRLEPAKTALVPGSSTLERVLRNLGVDTVLIAGIKTNVCCESTAREEHRATLETHIQQFGDVASVHEVLELLVQVR